MVECHLAKVKVAGPNPVSRSKTMYIKKTEDENLKMMKIILTGFGFTE